MEFLSDLNEKMCSEFNCVFSYGNEREKTESLLKKHNFEAWMVSPCPTYFIDKQMLNLCPTLRIISTPSTGSNHIDVSFVRERGIELFTLRGTKTVEQIYASSEFTFNLIISTIRNTPFAFQSALEGNWRNVEVNYRGRELNGLSLGIIGYGRIGRNIAKYSNAFGMKISAYDPYVKVNTSFVNQIKSLDELLPHADVIVVCVHLNEETNGMIDGNIFSQMKDGVYFINTSRGDVINERDFITYLNNGKILAAGVDVISDEFNIDKDQHPLINYARNHKNLIITPHIAGLTYDSEEKAQKAAYEAIKRYFK